MFSFALHPVLFDLRDLHPDIDDASDAIEESVLVDGVRLDEAPAVEDVVLHELVLCDRDFDDGFAVVEGARDIDLEAVLGFESRICIAEGVHEVSLFSVVDPLGLDVARLSVGDIERVGLHRFKRGLPGGIDVSVVAPAEDLTDVVGADALSIRAHATGERKGGQHYT